MASPTVLLLDNDLGFLFALSEELSRRHIAAFPARSAEEARSMISRFRLSPEVLILHCGRPGACAVAEACAKTRPESRMVAFVSGRHQCKQCASRIAAQLRDPEDRKPERISHCADIIQALLRDRRRHTRHAGGN